MNESDVAFIHEAIGGADRFQELAAFAQEFAPSEVIDAFNQAVIDGDKTKVLAYLTAFSVNQIKVNQL
ncbi:hypothetical protein FZX09_04035 [Synechococcus sp. MU1643]|uniref:hypothetical protein n=1 Tax=Synechococcus sp. MU1643 TaxID=2508349 RepID=UPI001CF8C304|nr:hypothetical protein [Synechococcus sp. MU1643]MCB4427982.1 hypothetical protein [Synechococcus sp. MU1643]